MSTSDQLENLLHISMRLVVLQNLRNCYVYECYKSELNQETKNFRSACILDELKDILDKLVNHVTWLVDIESGAVPCPVGHKEGVTRIIHDLNDLYTFVLEEATKKEARFKLMQLEESLFNEA